VEPLYRKVNTRTRNVFHGHGGNYRKRRNTEGERTSDETRGRMRGRQRRGLDYTPLFRFLLSKVGEEWDEVFGAAKARLDSTEPIFWLVARQPHERQAYVGFGESTFFSGLFVDDDNRLRKVDPSIGPESLEPWCACCTHTFNGVRFVQKYRG